MFKYKRSYRRYAKKQRVKKAYGRRRAANNRLARIKDVKRIIHRNVENKHVSRVVDTSAHNSSIGNADRYPICPVIKQGATQLTRLGDSIKPKYLKLRYRINWDDSVFLIGKHSCTVRVMVLQQKDVRNEAYLANFDVNSILRINDGSSGLENLSFTGSGNDCLYPINTDLYTVYHDHKIVLTGELASGAGGTTTWNGLTQAYYRTVYLPVPSTLHFSNSTMINPDNYCPVMLVGYEYNDGTGPDLINTAVRVEAVSELCFEDA